jgi:hypothetical protein
LALRKIDDSFSRSQSKNDWQPQKILCFPVIPGSLATLQQCLGLGDICRLFSKTSLMIAFISAAICLLLHGAVSELQAIAILHASPVRPPNLIL